MNTKQKNDSKSSMTEREIRKVLSEFFTIDLYKPRIIDDIKAFLLEGHNILNKVESIIQINDKNLRIKSLLDWSENNQTDFEKLLSIVRSYQGRDFTGVNARRAYLSYMTDTRADNDGRAHA
ncbi:MAG: hypothetical protein COT43_06980 [Candidatus Marinimicrobia bacterium CG08_land_8_20_14_0_20_45_22]|nr:MAG: hypothetical protein COT43_06980 [Candidatus Marinimicrobia bacterium CG08_land_8_20_14_0_20_45_22]